MKCRVLGLEVYFWRKMGVSRPWGYVGLMRTIRDSVTVGGVLRNSKSLAASDTRTPTSPHHRNYTNSIPNESFEVVVLAQESGALRYGFGIGWRVLIPNGSLPHDFVHEVLRLLAAISEQLRAQSIRVQRLVSAYRI